MTKQEIKKAIENDESVWCSVKLEEVKLNKTDYYVFDGLLQNKVLGVAYFIKTLFKTKAEAEHYLYHANITRTETLPFVTWEEFKEQKFFKFNSADNVDCMLQLVDNGRKIALITHTVKYFKATEENFYKVYDEIVKEFKGKE